MRSFASLIAASCLLATSACQGRKDADKEPGADFGSTRSSAELAGAGPIFFASIEGRPQQFSFGKAYATSGILHIVLSTEKTPCTFVPGTQEAYRIRFDLTPGPGARFFAGTLTGVGANFESRRTRLSITAADPYLVTVNIAPFALKGGARVQGWLEFDVKLVKTKTDRTKQAYQTKGAGYFDVEICDDSETLKELTGQPEEVPDGEVAGTFVGSAREGQPVPEPLHRRSREPTAFHRCSPARQRVILHPQVHRGCERRHGPRSFLRRWSGARLGQV